MFNFLSSFYQCILCDRICRKQKGWKASASNNLIKFTPFSKKAARKAYRNEDLVTNEELRKLSEFSYS